jgi:hypothetical protein
MMKRSLAVAGLVALAPLATPVAWAQSGPGSSQENPVLPNTFVVSTSGPQFFFTNPTSGLWFDPVPVYGFRITLLGATGGFTSVQASSWYSNMQIRTPAGVLDPDFDAGEIYTFTAPRFEFDIIGIQPYLDPGASNFTQAFPLKLTFTGSPNTMFWTALPAPVPETSTFGLMLLGLSLGGLGLGWARRRRG